MKPIDSERLASFLVLGDEDPAEWRRLCDRLNAQWQPRGMAENHYVESLARYEWRLMRVQRWEAGLDRQDALPEDKVRLRRDLAKYRASIQRGYAQVLRFLLAMRKPPLPKRARPAPKSKRQTQCVWPDLKIPPYIM